MRTRAGPDYSNWLNRNVTSSVLIYSGLIAILLPLFHFVLRGLPGVPPGSDSLSLRCIAGACSLAIGGALFAFPALRRHAIALQYLNTLVAVFVIAMLVVNSRDHYAYIASGLLVIIGAQQAFYRTVDLVIVFALGFAFQALYSAQQGVLWTPANLAALGTFGSAYIIATIPAALRIRIQGSEIRSRIEAQRVKDELQEVHAITQLGKWSRDLRTGAVEWSAELYRIFALVPGTADVSGRYEASLHPEDRASFERGIAVCRRERTPLRLDHRILLPDGSLRWVELYGKYEYDESGAPSRWVSAVLDITQRKAAEDGLVRLARYDTLTGLPNRATFYAGLSDAVGAAGAMPFAVLFLDLDRFKDINDTFGHEIGDRLLAEASRRFSNVLLPNAVLCRWGGDEFVATVPAEDEQTAATIARRLVRAAAEPFQLEGLEHVLTVSVGITLFPRDGTEPGVLIRNADTAMYEAKHNPGYGYAVFTEELHAAAAQRRHIQHTLLRALAEDRFVLHYQPIVDVVTGRIVAAEALVRWVEDDGRVHEPAEFIAVAEESGSIVPLGTWVMRTACAQSAQWRARGLELTVSINVSPRQFARGDFVQILSQIIEETGADPAALEIEITEAAIMSNVEPILETLQDIRAMGIRVAIDDFGTGYSSFAYLKRFEVDSLKIDRTFVSGIEADRDLAIAKSIITVAQTLGLPITAEGVETQLQRTILSGLDCDRLQGYHLGRPAPVHEFELQLTAFAEV